MAEQTISPWQSFAWNKIPPGLSPASLLLSHIVPHQMSPFSRACTLHLHSSLSQYVAGFSHFSGPHRNMMIVSSVSSSHQHYHWHQRRICSTRPIDVCWTNRWVRCFCHCFSLLLIRIQYLCCYSFPTLNSETPSSANFDFRLLSFCGFFGSIVSSAHTSLVLVP